MKLKAFLASFLIGILPSVILADTGAVANLDMVGYSYTDSVGLRSYRAVGQYKDVFAVRSGDELFFIDVYGHNGTAFTSSPSASITFVASENWSSTDGGSDIAFSVTPNDSTTSSEVMRISNSGNLGLGTTNPSYMLDVTDNFVAGAGLNRGTNLLASGLSLASGQVYFGHYAQVISTGTTDNTANAAHFGAAVYRSSDTASGRTDSITLEARNDARTVQASVDNTALLAYMDAISTGTAFSNYYALRITPCISSDGDCGTDVASGNLFGLAIEDLQGGGTSSRALYQAGTDDLNVLMSSTNFGTNTLPTAGARVQITQAGGAGLVPAFQAFSGGAASDLILSLGRTAAYEEGIYVPGTAGNWVTGSSVGDLVIASLSTSNAIHISAGTNAVPEFSVTNSTVTINDVLRITPRATAPSSPSSGQIYVDSTPNPDELCFYDGAAWQGLSSGTDANCS
jgi:hypothetical protein